MSIKRRDVLKLAMVSGAGAAAGAVGIGSAARVSDETVTGECRFCTMHCGYVGTVRGDRLVEVRGDERSRTRGFLCQHGHALPEVVHGDARLLRPWKRESGPSTWEAALHDIGARLRALHAERPEALAVTTGWPFVRHPMIHLLHRFCRAFGTPNLATVASMCEASGRMGRTLVWGRNYSPDLAKVQTLLVWGANPVRSAPPWAFLVARAKNLVVIDPVRTELAEHAARYVRIRPGSDAAFSMGLLRRVLSTGLADERFIKDNTTGVEVLKQAVEPWTPERTARATGCAADDVAAVADLFAAGPAGVYDGLGVEHHGGGVDTVRLVSALVAVCGHKDAQRFDEGSPALRIEQQAPVPPAPAALPLGVDEHPLFCAVHGQAHASALWPAMLDGRVRALVCFGSNPVLTSPDADLVRRALANLELLVVVDPYLSETAALAHWALPAATFAEGARVPAQGESRADAEILFALAESAGLSAWFPWRTMTEAFAEPRTAVVDDWARARLPAPPDRIDLAAVAAIAAASTDVDDAGDARRPGSLCTSEYPLVLVTGPRQRAYINSQFHRVRSVTRVVPRATAKLHPVHGVVDGAEIAVVTPAGRARFRAEVTADVAEDVVVVPHGWAGDANANELTTWAGKDPISGFPRFRSLACRIEA